MIESVKIEAWIESCSQEIDRTKRVRHTTGLKSFDQLSNKLCDLLADAQRQACHARLVEGVAMERKTE